MAERTGIEWTDATWNPIRGCSRESQGCLHCYAEPIAVRFSGPGLPYEGVADRDRAGSKWTGVITFHREVLDGPLTWRKSRKIFVNSMSDLFHPKVETLWLDQIFGVMAACPQHIFQVLTKRGGLAQEYTLDAAAPRRVEAHANAIAREHRRGRVRVAWPLPNVHLGVSAEDQDAAEQRIPPLLRAAAAVRFVSAEPLLGPIDLTRLRVCNPLGGAGLYDALRGTYQVIGLDSDPVPDGPRLQWVIAGGESGPRARPMHPDWPRLLRDDCAASGVPFFFKQWGEWSAEPGVKPARATLVDPGRESAPWMPMSRVGRRVAGAALDGVHHQELPA